MRTSLTVMRPAAPTGISRRMISPSSRFNNSCTRWSLSDDIRILPVKSEFLRDALDGVALDAVTRLKFAKSVDADAAFHAGAHFVDFVLKPAQGLGHALVNEALAAHDADLAANDAAGGD